MNQLKQQIQALPADEQLQLCQWLMKELAEQLEGEQLQESSLRAQEIEAGKVLPISHELFWAEVDRHLEDAS
jgi:putative addiction module component (TIGR02574 family)